MGFWNNIVDFLQDKVNEYREPEHIVVRRSGEEEFLDYNLATALDIFTQRVQNGEARACYFLGLLHDGGYGVVTANKEAAMRFYQKGMEAEDILCGVRLVLIHAAEGTMNPTNADSIRVPLEAMANGGDVFAMNELAALDMYERHEPGQWNVSAANAGYWKAMLELSRYYWENADYSNSFTYAEMAVNRGAALAMRYLAQCYLKGKGVEQDFKKGIQLMVELNMAEPSAELTCEIGTLYEANGDMEKADRMYQKAAPELLGKKGALSAKSNYYIGLLHEKGIGVTQDSLQALNFNLLAAEQGDLDAKYKAGSWLIDGIVVDKDEKLGVRLLQEAADAGHADAQCRLASCHQLGIIFPLSYEKGVEWLRKSVENGSLEGLFWLGGAYNHGYGVPQDKEKGFDLIKIAAKKGNANGEYTMSLEEEHDMDKRFQLITSAARKGHKKAQYILGEIYWQGNVLPSPLFSGLLRSTGGKSIPTDVNKALFWFNKSAQQGFVDSEYMLGLLYLNGNCVEKKEQKGIHFLELSAKQGRTDAFFELGRVYAYGKGVQADGEKAIYWWEKAAAKGHISAKYNIGIMYGFGRNIEKDLEKAKFWYEKAAQDGHEHACHNLAEAYELGSGCEKDLSKAL